MTNAAPYTRLLLLFVAVTVAVQLAQAAPIDPGNVTVIDGDTIRLNHRRPDVRLVGASGGIAGLWGAAMVVAWRLVKRGKQALFALVVMFVLGYLLFQQVQGAIASADGNIAHLAHLGGILAGALIGTRLPLRFNYDSKSGS